MFSTITIGIDQVIFSISHFMVRWYGLIVSAAIGVGLWLTAREAKRKGIPQRSLMFWLSLRLAERRSTYLPLLSHERCTVVRAGFPVSLHSVCIRLHTNRDAQPFAAHSQRQPKRLAPEAIGG